MASDKNMVKFLMPDGTEVSNDPGFDLNEALAKSLNSRPDTGQAGPTWDEQQAQIQATRLASLQSGQAGVGQNATLDDPSRDAYGPLGSPAQQTQKEDAEQARKAGASPKSTSVDDDKPVDSNERVKELQARHTRAADRLGDGGEGDPETPYSEWTAKQLKLEVAKRNAEDNRSEENELKIVRGMKAADVANMLTADDEANSDADDEDDEDSDENSDNK